MKMDPTQIRLVEEVEQHRELWDIKTPNYKLTFKRKNVIWDEIAATLNISRDQAKQQWRNIKDYYRSVRARLRSQPGGPDATPLTPLQEQQKQYLSFMDEVLDAKATWNTVPGPPPLSWWPAPSPTGASEETDSGTFDTVFKAEMAAEAGSADDADAPEHLPAPPAAWAVQVPRRTPKRQRTDSLPEVIHSVEATLNQMAENDSKKSKHSGFFDEIDDLMQRMSPKKAYEFKVKMYGEAVKSAFPESGD